MRTVRPAPGGERAAVAALAGILAISAAWWALALWPADTETPAWVLRTRVVCFGVRAHGLPDAAGWLTLVGEPLGMLGFLFLVWGRAVRAGLASMAHHAASRAVLSAGAIAIFVGLGAAATRVRDAARDAADTQTPFAATRIDRPAPPLTLVDQRGDTVRLADLRGRPVLVAFAYGHCETVCPAVVHDAVRAVADAPGQRPALLVVTLDPWRDTPERLPSLAHAWQLPPGARVLGGDVPLVQRALDDWGIPRSRDGATGAIAHDGRLFVVDAAGRLAYSATGGGTALGELLRRL